MILQDAKRQMAEEKDPFVIGVLNGRQLALKVWPQEDPYFDDPSETDNLACRFVSRCFRSAPTPCTVSRALRCQTVVPSCTRARGVSSPRFFLPAGRPTAMPRDLGQCDRVRPRDDHAHQEGLSACNTPAHCCRSLLKLGSNRSLRRSTTPRTASRTMRTSFTVSEIVVVGVDSLTL
jgi:hypothetical protein